MINIGSTAGRRLFCVNPGSVQSCSLGQIYITDSGRKKAFMLSLVGIIVGLALLIFLAFRGKSLLWAAPVCALLVAFTGGLDMFTAYTQNYMEGMVGFVKEWFPAFMLGAIFGQIMQDSGGAVSLTKAVVKLVGRDKAIFASVLCGGVLAYGDLRLRHHFLHVSHCAGAVQGG